MWSCCVSASYERAFGGTALSGGARGACARGEWACRNAACVPHAALCDGGDDCGDYSDESHCSEYTF